MKTLRVVCSLKSVRSLVLAGLAIFVTSTALLATENAAGKDQNTAGALNFPQGVAVNAAGEVFVADSYNNVIRKVSPSGEISTFAGMIGVSGSNDGKGGTARFYYPQSLAIDSHGNLFVADSWNYTLRKVTPQGVVTTVAGCPGQPGSSDGKSSQAKFGYLSGVAVDCNGMIYVADVWNKSIRKITPQGEVATLAGGTGEMGCADGVGTQAQFGYLSGLAVDRQGNIYVPDVWSKTIRKVSPNGMVTTLAGVAGQAGSKDGMVTHALFHNPLGVAVDHLGNVYVADEDTIRKVTPSGSVTTVAGGSGVQGLADGPGQGARFGCPIGIAVDADGIVYVADSENYALRKVSLGGIVTTMVGKPWNRPTGVDGFQLASPKGGVFGETHGEAAILLH